MPHIKPEYFDAEHRIVYEIGLDFIGKYNKLPTPLILETEFEKSPAANEKNYSTCLDLIRECGRVEKDINLDWLCDSAEKWCKERALFLALMESIAIIDGQSKINAEGAIPNILQTALGVTFDTNVGHDYLADAESRYEFYHTPSNRIPFSLHMLNVITGGGLKRKTLNILLAGTAVGKSMAMCHLAADDLAMGRNVLYITMEMSEESIAERIDANLLDTTMETIVDLTREQFTSKIAKIKEKSHGKLIIKEYPTGSAHVGHFRALLNELKLKKNFIPDIVYIDYINICTSSRIRGLGGNVNSYTLVKAIAEEFRGLGVEFDIPIWSATQVTREGFNDSDFGLTETSESWGLPGTADLMLAMISTEQLEKMNQILIKQLKNRYNNSVDNKRFMLGVDRSRMRLYDLDDPTANVMSTTQKSSPVKQTPFTTNGRKSPIKPTLNFDNLKV
jgi:hypothetical protein